MQNAVGLANQLLDAAMVSVYPNPANNLIMVDGMQVAKAEVIDVTGKLMGIYQNPINGIDVATLPNGIYLIKLTNINNQIVVKKISIVH